VTGPDDYYEKMRALPLDDMTADRLLSGAMSPADAPPEYSGLADLIQKLRASRPPVASSPPAAEQTLVAAMSAAVLSSPVAAGPRRTARWSRLVTAKVVAAATVGLFGIGTAAAAATGSLPGQRPRPANGSVGTSSHPPPPSPALKSPLPSRPAGGSPATTTPATAHPATIPAQIGVCTAFLAATAGASSTHVSFPFPQGPGAAFQALMSRHGGKSATIAYCQSVVRPGQQPPVVEAPVGGAAPANGRRSDAAPPAQAQDNDRSSPMVRPGSPGSSGGRPTDRGEPAEVGTPRGAGNSSGRPPSTPSTTPSPARTVRREPGVGHPPR
jgi:hypothetical protein